MKKLLACLMALVLPCCALADALTIRWSADASVEGLRGLTSLLEDYMEFEQGALFTDEWLAAAAECISGFTFSFVVDGENGRSQIALSYQDEALITFDINTDETADYLTSNMMPGLLAVSSPSLVETESLAEALSALADQPWGRVLSALEQRFDGWFSTLYTTTEVGSYFAGDAYAGEGRCLTVRFDERDVAVLLESLARAPWPEAFEQLLRGYSSIAWDDENALADSFRSAIHEAAFRNQYSYVLRIVENARDTSLVGLSLLTYEDEQLVGTLSMGFEDDEIRIVLGYGLRGDNVYIALTLQDAPANEPVMLAKLWSDPNKLGYYAVSSDPRQTNLELSGAVYADGDDSSLSVVTEWWGAALMDNFISVGLSCSVSDDSLLLDASYGLGGAPLYSSHLSFTYDPACGLAPLETAGLQVIQMDDLSPEDDRLLMDSLERGLSRMMLRLFKLLPPRLMTIPLTPNLLF